MTVLLSDVLKTAFVATLLVIVVSYLPKVLVSLPASITGYNNNNYILSPMVNMLDSIYHRVKKATKSILSMSKGSSTFSASSKKRKTSQYTTPMPFEGDGGWGKCTLRSKKVLGSSSPSSSSPSSSFTVYEFALPESYYTIPLTLGQQLEFCCLSSNDDICTGSFYPLDGGGGGDIGDGIGGHTNNSAGVVRVVLPNDTLSDEGNSKFVSFFLGSSCYSFVIIMGIVPVLFAVLGKNNLLSAPMNDLLTTSHYPLCRAFFLFLSPIIYCTFEKNQFHQMEVLRNELRPGDEVAIKPGKSHLTYNGKHVPVTDMVYLAYGLGIVPILDQVCATLPRGSSSVKVSSVTWFNDNRQDFDIAMDDLEREYMKHPNKLAVSCIMEDALNNRLEGNKEVEESVPYFNAGTMAVVAGPKRFAEKAVGYLMRRGYPENCICVLP